MNSVRLELQIVQAEGFEKGLQTIGHTNYGLHNDSEIFMQWNILEICDYLLSIVYIKNKRSKLDQLYIMSSAIQIIQYK